MKGFVLAGSTVSSARCLMQYRDDASVILSGEAAKAGEALVGWSVGDARAVLVHVARRKMPSD